MGTGENTRGIKGFSCKTAVLNAYRNLRETGLDDAYSFQAAVRVYRHHHPEIGSADANYRVADWIGGANKPSQEPSA